MNIFRRTVAMAISIVFLATGCAQLHNVPLARSDQGVARPDVQVGDRVIVTTKDGVEHKFQVIAVDAEAMRGTTDRIAYADMQRLDVRRGAMRPGKTALVVGAVILGAAAIGAASGGGSGSGGY